MMDFNKFYREGWGLHRGTIEKIYEIIKDNDIKSVIEFGSGASTEFFIQARNELNRSYTIDSFDHNPLFSYNNSSPDYLKLMIRDLVVCEDSQYEDMFKTKIFNSDVFVVTDLINDTRVKNATYKIKSDDLRDTYDLVLIDGPNGNGRNFSYFYLQNRLKSGSFVVIDDYFHYDFVERLGEFFEYELIDEIRFIKDHPNKGHFIARIK